MGFDDPVDYGYISSWSEQGQLSRRGVLNETVAAVMLDEHVGTRLTLYTP